MRQKLIIVGAGMAAAYLLQELLAQEHQWQITLIGDEPDVCYNRVMLSGVLAGETADSDLQMLPVRHLQQGLQLLANTRVREVNTHEQTVLTEGGELLAYDKLVFATGATVARPDLEVDGIEGVRVLRTLEDVRFLRNQCSNGRRAVVVGGGLLGLEAAHGLNAMGFETSVIHRQPYLMNRQLDAEGGQHLRDKMVQSGIRFYLGNSVAALHASDGTLTSIDLHDGSELSCDLLVFATGIEPRTGLARDAGIACARGILVDEYLQTSVPHCFALGECSQLGSHCFGLVAPIKAQAAVLAAQLSGAAASAFALEDWPVQLKISGIEIFSAGAVESGGEELVLHDKSAGIYRRLVLQGDRLVGAVLVGDKRDGIWYAQLIRNATDISRYRPGLMFGKAVSEAMQLSAIAA
jgi:NAD(P)H-nitrite reductase large subunit